MPLKYSKNRCNKDNFWNLMFFSILSCGVAIAFASGIMIISWFAIAGSIWITKRKATIDFDKEQSEFIINDNKKIKAFGGEIIIMLFASFGIIALLGFILDGLNIKDSPVILGIMMSLLAFMPILYCILRNLPIAVYFKKEAWIACGQMSYAKAGIDYKNSNLCSNSSNNNRSMVTDPSYRYLSCNVYHRR